MTVYNTPIDELILREATRADIGTILGFIRELAEYEGLLNEVKATEATLARSLFDEGFARVVLAEEEGAPVGFALYFFNFSTFEGRPGLYLEDLYVVPEARGRGYGKALLGFLANEAVRMDARRFEWWCLDANKPSYAFYKAIGAEDMVDWTVFRIDGDRLKTMAENFRNESKREEK